MWDSHFHFNFLNVKLEANVLTKIYGQTHQTVDIDTTSNYDYKNEL